MTAIEFEPIKPPLALTAEELIRVDAELRRLLGEGGDAAAAMRRVAGGKDLGEAIRAKVIALEGGRVWIGASAARRMR